MTDLADLPATSPDTGADALKASCPDFVHVPGDPGYDQGRAAWNLAAEQLPAAVGTPRTVDQLAAVTDGSADNVVGSVLFDVFVENKFLGLFALLFGLGFSIQLDRARSRGAELLPMFRRRLGWLFAFGVAHAWLLWWGDILRFYAVWGLLLPLFAARRPRTLLVWGLLLGVVLPAGWRVGISLAASAVSASVKDAAGESLEAATLEAAIAANPDDHQARLDLAVVLNAEGKRLEAAEALVASFKRDRSWNEEAARKKLLEFFEAWGPKDPATLKGRRLLSAVLFS